MLPSETMIWQPEFTDKTLSRKPGAVHKFHRLKRCKTFTFAGVFLLTDS
ncbi:AMP nucleosidase [Escherichia coli]|nr:AMP nucleosidase [Escherichia coli]EFB2236813.1 AMP nucleosidase [Escherichia coli]EGE0732083.1 AMP nucleosidase [Escherichia coli]HAH5030400.1 AMP nucleosidase [Escherichia coli]HAH6836677.1 AMP nucleosidase [Escherichia coli]